MSMCSVWVWAPIVLLRFAAGEAGLAQTSKVGAGAPPRAVVLVTVDTLRADYVSFLRPDGPITTPYLDSLAKTGAIFTRAYAPSSWTSPSMASLFTSLFPKSHGVVTGAFLSDDDRVVRQERLSESFVTLAESFAKAGYLTIGVPANRHLEASQGFSQGFDHYLDEAPFMLATGVNRHVRRLMQQAFGGDWRSDWKKRKTFLWIHYFDPHSPWRAREPWIGEYAAGLDASKLPEGLTPVEVAEKYPKPGPKFVPQVRPLYRSEVRYWDDSFARLAAELELADPDVLLVFSSDHGEELGEHGGIGHGHSLYEEVVKVPLLVRWPEGLQQPRQVDRPVSLLDVYPTLLQLADIEAPPGLQGHSVVPALRGRPALGRPLIRFQLDRNGNRMVGVTDGEWKLIRKRRKGSRPELYRLSADPSETENLASEQRDRARRLSLGLREWIMGLPEAPDEEAPAPVEDQELKQQLEALGYLDGG